MNVSPKRGKMVNGFDPANAGSLSMRSQDFIDRRDPAWSSLPVVYENPGIQPCEWVFMYDLTNNIWMLIITWFQSGIATRTLTPRLRLRWILSARTPVICRTEYCILRKNCWQRSRKILVI